MRQSRGTVKHHPGEQFLFCYGHSVAGQTETYAYIGMYWTWGKDKNKPDAVATTWVELDQLAQARW